MRRTLLLGWLLAIGLLLPTYAKAADNGNWDDNWAYFQSDGEAKAADSSVAPTTPDGVCSNGLNHYGSPCWCLPAKSGKVDSRQLMTCKNPFVDDSSFLDDFRDLYSGELHVFSLPLSIMRTQSTCSCPNECGGTYHCGGCGAHEEDHGQCAGGCGEYNCAEGAHCEGCLACGGQCDMIVHEPPVIIASIPVDRNELTSVGASKASNAIASFPPGTTSHLACQWDNCDICTLLPVAGSPGFACLAAQTKAIYLYCTGQFAAAAAQIEFIRNFFNQPGMADRLQAGMNRAQAAYGAVSTAINNGGGAALSQAWNNAKSICGPANAGIWLSSQPMAVQNAVNALP